MASLLAKIMQLKKQATRDSPRRVWLMTCSTATAKEPLLDGGRERGNAGVLQKTNMKIGELIEMPIRIC